MNCDDDLTDFIGSKLLKAELKGVRNETFTIDDDGWYREIQFLEITTNKGCFTVANYNEHNGYYGGFDVECGK